MHRKHGGTKARRVAKAAKPERSDRAPRRRDGARAAAASREVAEPSTFASVGHDLLQPLLAARLSLAQLSDLQTTKAKRALVAQIDQSLLAIEEQVLGALDVAKLEAGVVAPVQVPVLLDPLFKSLQTLLMPVAVRKGIELTHSQTALVTRTDPRLLRRILQNLMANAIQYTDSGRVRVLARARAPSVRVEIWDTGPGIAADDRQRIFDAFRRGRSSGAAKSGSLAIDHDHGHGLGLAIVHRLAQRLGHPIGFFSKPAHGSCFWIELPSAPQEEPGTRRDRGTYGIHGTRVVLIVGREIERSALRLLLTSWGCEINTCASVEEFVRRQSGAPFPAELLLADVPSLTTGGRAALASLGRVRKSVGGPPLPAIVIADGSQPGGGIEGMEGQIEELATPIRPAALRALMVHMLR